MTRRARLAQISLFLSLALVAWFAIAMLGARAGLWRPLTGFATMTMQPAPYLLGICALVAVIALVASLARAPRRGWMMALVALAIPAAIFSGLGALRSQAQSVPFIHDVATDTADPPSFSEEMLATREADGARNRLYPYDVPLDTLDPWRGQEAVAGRTAAQLIQAGYSDLDLTTLRSDAEPAIALKAIDRAMSTRGLENIARDEEAGRVEGTAVVFWYGFRDDVVGRVRPASDGGSVIDFRSASRVGLSDLGVNAARIDDLRRGVQEILEDPAMRRQLRYQGEDAEITIGTEGAIEEDTEESGGADEARTADDR